MRTKSIFLLLFALLTIGAEAQTQSTTWAGSHVFKGGITAPSFRKPGGTSNQFLKADGSIDSTVYATSYTLKTINGQSLFGSGNLSITSGGDAYLGNTQTWTGTNTFANILPDGNSTRTIGGLYKVFNTIFSRRFTSDYELELRHYNGIRFIHEIGNITQASISNDGNLLLGSTVNSGEKLQVNGTSKFTGNMSVAGSITATNGTNSTLTNSSLSLYSGNYIHAVNGAGGSNFSSYNSQPFVWSARQYIFGPNYSGVSATASSGTENIFSITPVISQGGTASYRGLFLSASEVATGSGTKTLVDVGTSVSGTHTSVFNVDNVGNTTIGGNAGFQSYNIAGGTGLIQIGRNGNQDMYLYQKAGYADRNYGRMIFGVGPATSNNPPPRIPMIIYSNGDIKANGIDALYNGNTIIGASGSPVDQGYKLDVNGHFNASGVLHLSSYGALTQSGGKLYHYGSGIGHIFVNTLGGSALADLTASGLALGNTTSTSTATPLSLSLGGTFSSTDGTQANAKLKIYNDGSNVYGITVGTGNELQNVVPVNAGYGWYSNAVKTMSLNSSGDLTLPSRFLVNSAGVFFGNLNSNTPYVNYSSTLNAPKYSFISNTGYGLGLQAVGVLGLFANGTSAINIPSTGNVLIKGTVDTGEALQVNGDATVNTSKTGSVKFDFNGSYVKHSSDNNNYIKSERYIGGTLVDQEWNVGVTTYKQIQAAGSYFIRSGGTAHLLVTANGQVAIGLESGLNPSAKFEVRSTDKGVLLPRMTTAQFNAIPTKAEGLEAYSTDDHGKLWYDGTRVTGFRFTGTKFQGYDGTTWVDLN